MHAFAASSTFLPRSPKQLWVMDCSGLSTHSAIFIIVSLIVFIFHTRKRGRERAHSIPFKYVLLLKWAGSKDPTSPLLPLTSSSSISCPSLFLVWLRDFVGCQEETNKGLSTGSTIIQVGQLHNNFSSIHHWASVVTLSGSSFGDLRVFKDGKP